MVEAGDADDLVADAVVHHLDEVVVHVVQRNPKLAVGSVRQIETVIPQVLGFFVERQAFKIVESKH